MDGWFVFQDQALLETTAATSLQHCDSHTELRKKSVCVVQKIDRMNGISAYEKLLSG